MAPKLMAARDRYQRCLMRTWTLSIVIALFVSACQTPDGTLFKANVQPGGSHSMPVVLGDQTGLVTAIESTTGDWSNGSLPAVQADIDDPRAVIVSWGTGACDKATGLSSDAGLRLDIQIDEGFNLTGCTADLLIRALRVRFSKAIPAASITVLGGR